MGRLANFTAIATLPVEGQPSDPFQIHLPQPFRRRSLGIPVWLTANVAARLASAMNSTRTIPAWTPARSFEELVSASFGEDLTPDGSTPSQTPVRGSRPIPYATAASGPQEDQA
jgi:hypothetical protein